MQVYTVKPCNLLILGPSKIVLQIVSSSSKWDRMVYNTVLTAEKLGPHIAGVYCICDDAIYSKTLKMTASKVTNLAK